MTPYHVRPMDLHRESEWCNHYDCSVVVMKHEYDVLAATLKTIAEMPNEDNEWDAVDKYDLCRAAAKAALGMTAEGK